MVLRPDPISNQPRPCEDEQRPGLVSLARKQGEDSGANIETARSFADVHPSSSPHRATQRVRHAQQEDGTEDETEAQVIELKQTQWEEESEHSHGSD